VTSTNDLKNGMVLDLDGQLWSVVWFQHHKPGKGNTVVRTKLKHVLSGKVVDKTFNSDTKVDTASVDRREMQYLYHDGSGFVFMDTTTYDQLTIPDSVVGDAKNYLLEEQMATVALHEGNPLYLDLPASVEKRITYTGYLRREVPPTPSLTKYPKITKQPFILVTTGGGGDGDDLIDWVISAYEADAALEMPALILFGPFIDRDKRSAFVERIAKQPKLDVLSFDNKIEWLMKKAEAIVAMGGYNTFCEALSFDKRTLIVPRTKPRLEQYIRAVEAERLGLVSMLSDYREPRTPERMAEALRSLAAQPRPSEVVIPGLLDGLDRVQERLKALMEPANVLAAYHEAAE